MEPDTRSWVAVVHRWSGGLPELARYGGSFWSCERPRGERWRREGRRREGGRGVESRTRFKRKVLWVNGAEVMPRSQQQHPPFSLFLSAFISPCLFSDFPSFFSWLVLCFASFYVPSPPIFSVSWYPTCPGVFDSSDKERWASCRSLCLVDSLLFCGLLLLLFLSVLSLAGS